ncbi:MAG: heparinase II/III family protein [Kiritimatiellae bacterium]|nr:heparinase II/III family protein [Kiritimatiellia bacterium]
MITPAFLDPSDPLAHLRPEHPRLLLLPDRAEALAAQSQNDTRLSSLLQTLDREAEDLAHAPRLTRVLDGPGAYRLLETSRETLRRIFLLGILHRLSPSPKYIAQARDILLNVANFSDWNPPHFLDTAEMAAAVAIGYDWFYHDLSPSNRETLREALIRHALRPGMEDEWWITSTHNWNPVCHGGLSLAALAIAEHHPDLARSTLARTRDHLPLALESYAPDGVHEESPSYWDYGTGYLILLATALHTAIDNTWGIFDAPGIEQTFAYRLHVIGPTGDAFNYGDGNPHSEPLVLHPIAARFLNRPGFAAAALPTLTKLQRNRLAPLAVIGFPDESLSADTTNLPLDFHGKGQLEFVSLRGTWHDPLSPWIALRAGTIQVNHAHMDLGTFVFEAGGIRWAHDLGKEDAIYAGRDAWGLQADSPRWNYLRAGVHSHNTLVLDQDPQNVLNHCPVTKFRTQPDHASARIDLTPAWPEKADAITRTFHLENHRKHFRLVDELTNPRLNTFLRWQWVTSARIELADDRQSALLHQQDRTLRLEIRSPQQGAAFDIASLAPPTPSEAPNTGFQMLHITWPAPLPHSARLEVLIHLI